MNWLYLFSLFFISCTQTLFIDPEIKPYLARWEKEHSRAITCPIGFGRMPIYIAGETSKTLFFGNSIAINPNSWYNMSNNRRYALLYHELGHCELNLEHDNLTIDKYGCPSYMASDILSEECAKKIFGEK